MNVLADIFPDKGQRWARRTLSAESWTQIGEHLRSGAWTLVAHWGETSMVHIALREPDSGATGILSLDTPDGHFPSLGRQCRPARRLERSIRDITGLEPVGAPDIRPWLDHGNSATGLAAVYDFLPVEGEELHQIAVGPVHAGIIEPGHFRFTASGETIVRLEARLGYAHKGTEELISGAPLARAAKLAGRVSGDSTVAYATAFAQAAETACGVEIPSRAVALRAVMQELERLANHVGDIGAICNDAAFSLMLAHCAIQRERILRTAAHIFGHRLMMDCVVPGGVACDLAGDAQALMTKLLKGLDNMLPALFALYEDTASLQDRTVRTGIVLHSLAKEFGAGGYIGRSSGRAFDARRDVPYAPYSELNFEVPVLERGDVDARVRIRFREAEQSISLLRQLLSRLPDGTLRTDVTPRDGEGAALVEGFRGDVFVWLRMSRNGTVARAHLRDPSWFQWPLLEAAIEGNIVADFPICNKSFNCSYSGHDL
jgi:Ni,Fe-hydrogenase III large subunit